MRYRFVAGRDAVLRITPWNALDLGAIVSATVSIEQTTGIGLPTPVVDEPATVTDSELSFALGAAQLLDPAVRGGHLYRAVWAYVIDGTSYEIDQLFEVRKRLLQPTLTEEEVIRNLPATVSELEEGGSIRSQVDDAWTDVLDDVAARGYEPDRIMDADRLRRPHRYKTLALLGASWGPNWREWAAKKVEEYGAALDVALNAGDWYDAHDDNLQAKDEVKVTAVRLTR